jgi:hypothetical protein
MRKVNQCHTGWTTRIKVLFLFNLGLLLGILAASLVCAQEITWVTVEGTAPIENNDKKKARSRAIDAALYNAVAEALAADISSEILIVNLRLSGSLLGAIPYGKVIKKQILEEKTEEISTKEKDKGALLYRVKIKAGVIEEDADADPSFVLDATLNQSGFTDGDDMQIHIKATKDCYLSMYNILEDEKILRLIPNHLKPNNFLAANQSFSFPDEQDQRIGIHLRAHVPKGQDLVTESIFIIATLQPFEMKWTAIQEGLSGVYNGRTAFMKDLIRNIVIIPAGERTAALVQYEIKKK